MAECQRTRASSQRRMQNNDAKEIARSSWYGDIARSPAGRLHTQGNSSTPSLPFKRNPPLRFRSAKPSLARPMPMRRLKLSTIGTPARPAVVPADCARCHTSAGFQDFAANGKVSADVPAPAGTFSCTTCHNPAAIALTSVTFPSGKKIENLGPEARCMQCHQGRESKVSVDKQITDLQRHGCGRSRKTDDRCCWQVHQLRFHQCPLLRRRRYACMAHRLRWGMSTTARSYDPKFRHVGGLRYLPRLP